MCPQHKQVSVRRSPPGVKSGLSRNGSETQAICRDHGRSFEVCATGMRKGWTLLGHRGFFAVHAQSVRKSHPAPTDLHECTCWNSSGFKWRNASALGNYDADCSLGGEHQLFPGQGIRPFSHVGKLGSGCWSEGKEAVPGDLGVQAISARLAFHELGGDDKLSGPGV